MIHRKRLTLAALFAAAVISTLPACGGGGGSADPSPTPAPGPATPSAPAPVSAPPPATGATASSCFENRTRVIGETTVLEFETITPSTSPNLTVTGTDRSDSILVSANATFEGQTGLYQDDGNGTASNTILGQTTTSNATGKIYTGSTATGAFISYGAVIKALDTVPSSGPKRQETFKTVFNPPLVETRGNLAEGASQTSMSNGVMTITLADGTVEPSTASKSSVTTKYVGKETVTVPAGTFYACKFESTTDVSSVISTSWVYRSRTIKFSAPVAGGGTQIGQLKFARINGAPL